MRETLALSANAQPPRGGLGQNFAHLIDGLRLDHDLEVYCLGGRAAVPLRVVSPSRLAGALQRVPVLRRRRDLITLASDVHFDRAVAERISRSRASVLIAGAGHGLRSARAARRRGMRVIVDSPTAHVNELVRRMDEEGARLGVRAPIGAWQRRELLAQYAEADAIRVMSRRALGSFVEHGVDERRVFVAEPPVPDLSVFPDRPLKVDPLVFGFVGLIEPWKGFHHLLEAYASVRPARAELILWGGTGARPITRLVEAHRRRDPTISTRLADVHRDGYGAVYGGMSVLVHPSLSDGWGFVVVEAMASGVPVIVTRASGAADLVEDGVNGFVIEPGDVGALRERLDHVSRHRDLLPAMGARARATVAERLTPARFRAALARALAGAEAASRQEARRSGPP